MFCACAHKFSRVSDTASIQSVIPKTHYTNVNTWVNCISENFVPDLWTCCVNSRAIATGQVSPVSSGQFFFSSLGACLVSPIGYLWMWNSVIWPPRAPFWHKNGIRSSFIASQNFVRGACPQTALAVHDYTLLLIWPLQTWWLWSWTGIRYMLCESAIMSQ